VAQERRDEVRAAWSLMLTVCDVWDGVHAHA
jgi:hypothetical protein